MGRANVDPPAVFHFDPAAEDASAGEDERVRAGVVDDGQLNVSIEGSGGRELPHRVSLECDSDHSFDLGHT